MDADSSLAYVPGAVARALMPLVPPEPSAELKIRLQGCESALSALQPCYRPCDQLWANRDKPALREAVHQLRHRLSPYMRMPALSLLGLGNREESEALIYQRWRRTLSGPLSTPDVQHFIALSTGGDGGLRTGPVVLRSQDGCTLLKMVEARDAAERLDQLLSRLAEIGPGHGVSAAVQMLALVNNAHAFTDGNGRLGRALFNFCLHRAGLPEACFIPLKVLTVLSRGGYEVRLREAELYGRWDGLYAYHCTAIELYAWLGQQPVMPVQNEGI